MSQLNSEETSAFLKKCAQLVQSFNHQKGDLFEPSKDKDGWPVALTFARKATVQVIVNVQNVVGNQISITYKGITVPVAHYLEPKTSDETYARQIYDRVVFLHDLAQQRAVTAANEKIDALFADAQAPNPA